MKTFTKMALALCVSGFISGNIEAKDVYVSAKGNDTNSGLSADSPRKTLTNLTSILEAGDVIHISGFIKIMDEKPLAGDLLASDAVGGHYWVNGNHNGFLLTSKGETSPWKDLTFVGEDPDSDGFDGESQTRLFHIKSEGADKRFYTFKNLGFENGTSPQEGGAGLFIHDHAVVNIENCRFVHNQFDLTKLKISGDHWDTNGAAERGGAIYFQFGELNIKDSYFENNIAKRGGAILQNGGEMTLSGCTFDGNDLFTDPTGGDTRLDNTWGGALYIWSLHTAIKCTIDRCLILNNTVWNRGGGMVVYSNVDSAHLMDVTISNSYFMGNKCIDGQGGCLAICNTENLGSKDDRLKNMHVKILNTTFYANESKSEGAGILLWGGIEGDTFTMTNCTVYGNTIVGEGRNAGHGCGYKDMNDKQGAYTPDRVKKSFYNCIFENNTVPAASDGVGEYSDFWTSSIEDYTIENCYIGRLGGTLDAELFPNNTIEYMGSLIGNEEEDPQLMENEDYLETFNMHVVPLADESPLRIYGNTDWLETADFTVTALNKTNTFTVTGYDISATDQLGVKRALDTEGSCVIGACEATLELLDEAIENGGEIPTGIIKITNNDTTISVVGDKNEIRAIGEGAERATISLMNMSGATVVKGIAQVTISSLPQGVYIVKVQVGGKVAIQKIAK